MYISVKTQQIKFILCTERQIIIQMKQQTQATCNLQALSLQLTNYLNDWIVQDNKLKNQIKNSLHSSKRIEKELNKMPKQRIQVCRIEFPVVQQLVNTNNSHNNSYRELHLPPIKNIINIKQHNPSRLASVKSQLNLKPKPNRYRTPQLCLMQTKSMSSIEKHQHQVLLRIKRMKKKSKNARVKSPQNICQKNIQFDFSKLKDMVTKQLKNNRKSAQKSIQKIN